MGSAHLSDDLRALAHGGNLRQAKRLYPEIEQWLDLSSAVNRHPFPAVEALTSESWMELPDLAELELAASNYYGRTGGVPIAGSQQAIEWLPVLLSQVLSVNDCPVLVPAIGYQEHEYAWRKWGYSSSTYQSMADIQQKSWRILVLIQPNNPTTKSFSPEEIVTLSNMAASRGGYLLVDEAFVDPRPDLSVLHHIQKQKCAWPDALIVLRSVGKFFGLPGARAGFCFANSHLSRQLASVIGPWPIATSAVQQVAAALLDRTWQSQAIADLKERCLQFRKHSIPRFECLSKLDWHESELFFTARTMEAERLHRQLLSVGIAVRLGDGWLRSAIPAWPEFSLLNDRLDRLSQ